MVDFIFKFQPTLQTRSVTASQLATDSPAKMNGHSVESPGNLENFKKLKNGTQLLPDYLSLCCLPLVLEKAKKRDKEETE